MTCTTCLSCGSIILPGCGCSCGCSSSDPCAEEVNCETVTQTINKMDFFIENTASFNMPACGDTATIFVEESTRLFPGAVLWNQTVGYLVVVSVGSGSVVVRNDCLSCNEKEPGEPVAANTQFGVSIPTCNSEGGTLPSSGPRLDLDFVIPDSGDCVTIKATTTDGLYLGDQVSINNQHFRISEIIDSVTLSICNDGDAGPEGSAIYKDPNGDGVLDYPIIRIGEQNPCLVTPVSSGKIVVCDGSVLKTLQGSIENQVPVYNPETEEFDLAVLPEFAACTVLTSCLAIDPSDPGPYLISVEDATVLSAQLAGYIPQGWIIYIGGYRFQVDDWTGSPEHFHASPLFTPGDILTFDAGTVVCAADCCESIVEQMNHLVDTTMPIDLSGNTGPQAITIAVGNSVLTFSNLFNIGRWNDDTLQRDLMVDVFSNIECYLDIPEGVYGNIEYRLVKVGQLANSQVMLAWPITGGRNHLADFADTDNLILDGTLSKNCNTCKGMISDHYVLKTIPTDPTDYYATWVAHARVVLENTTGGELSGEFFLAWRAWLTAMFCQLRDPVTT